jgi:hypothetical protein
MIQILSETSDDLVAIHITDGVTKDDYDKIAPLIDEKCCQYDKIRLYAELSEISDVGLGAIWEDLKMDVKHYNDFYRIAVVGPKDWKENLVDIAKQLVPAEVKYFDAKEVKTARTWISS